MEATNQKFNWQVLVYNETGQVLINTVINDRTETEIQTWRDTHEDETWTSVNITKK